MSGGRVLAIARRIVAGFRRDHRTLALLFVVPVVISALLGWIVTEADTDAPVLLLAVGDDELAGVLPDRIASAAGDAVVVAGLAPGAEAGRESLRTGAADLLLVLPAGTAATIASGGVPTLTIVTPGLDAMTEAGDAGRLASVLAAAFGGGRSARPQVVHETVYGSPDADQLDVLGPVFLGFFAYFFVFILTGISFLRERIGGTLERVLATPVRRAEVILGYSVGFGLFATLQVVVLLAFALLDVRTPAVAPLPELRIGLGVANAGSPLLVFLVVLLLALGAVNLGILLSTFARTELQILQFIPLVIVPQGLLAGLLWPVAGLPAALELVSRVMPMRYGIEGLRAVMVRGAGLDDAALQGDLLVLAGLALGFVILAGRTVRREVA